MREEYALAALPGGEYTFEYSPPPESTLNYARQFYPGRSTRAEANPVRVTAGHVTAGIDAELLLGGTITGRVTAASNGAGLKGVFVCALQSLKEGTGCALTSASGEYTIRWLPPGAYAIGFADEGYTIQYYKEKCAFAEADSVTVTGGSAASAINAVLRTGCGSVPPNPIGRPLEPPPPVSPPAAPMATGETAPLKGSVVATPSVVSLSNPTVAVSRNDIASLRLSCHGLVRCHARVTLWVTNTALKAGRRARRTVLLGNATATIAAGRVTTIKIMLRRAARAMLSARRASVSARITIAELETGLTSTVLVHLVPDKSLSRR
jgi:hypothetical protein